VILIDSFLKQYEKLAALIETLFHLEREHSRSAFLIRRVEKGRYPIRKTAFLLNMAREHLKVAKAHHRLVRKCVKNHRWSTEIDVYDSVKKISPPEFLKIVHPEFRQHCLDQLDYLRDCRAESLEKMKSSSINLEKIRAFLKSATVSKCKDLHMSTASLRKLSLFSSWRNEVIADNSL